ncbi:MAG: hypothetical protein HYR55_10645 [Acidobacteria bacterium]|nr:hypothetical protein [Acidobacteriota bacterium]MBI3658062.1 hypothetical protein [Acidobacteriota bacterium]
MRIFKYYVLIGLLAVLSVVAISTPKSKPKEIRTATTTAATPKSKLKEIRTAAAAWLDALDPDPIRIRKEKEMKGKKHFVEALHGYLYLHTLAENAHERRGYKKRVIQLSQATKRPEYHNLAGIPLAEFREESTSYLNACYVMQIFGLDTAPYKAEIEKVLPRILEDMPKRGINQQLAFRYLLNKLGFAAMFRVDDLMPRSVIRQHRPLKQLNVSEQYDVTHEIFPLGEFGRKKISEFSKEDMDYLRKLMAAMVQSYTAADNIDLLAEVIVCMRFLDFDALPEYRKGLDYILTQQNSNGSFGHYETQRQQMRTTRPKYDVDIGGYLHTTEVCLWALAEAFMKGASKG